jgi:hypothetical protein
VIFVWNYLVIYNRRAGEIVRRGRFETAAAALEARFAAEHEFCDEPDIEIVVLGAESWAALYGTHSRYFKGVQELAGAALERESRSR